MRAVGMLPVVVHGGGPQIGELMARLGKETEFRNGLRVTDADTLDIARMVLVGKVNRDIVSAINVHGPLAVGMSGEDANLITAAQRHADLGFVGNVSVVDPTMLERLVAEGLIPVVATIGADESGQAYNINADTVAGALAEALHAEKLIFLTDIEGLRVVADDPTTVIHQASLEVIDEIVRSGGVAGRHDAQGRGVRQAPCAPGSAGRTSSTGACPTRCCSSSSPTRGSGRWCCRDRSGTGGRHAVRARLAHAHLRRAAGHLRAGPGHRPLRRRRHGVPRLHHRPGGGVARPRPPGRGRRRGRAGADAQPRVEPLRQHAGPRGRPHHRPADQRRHRPGRRPGLLRQLGGGGQRVRAQAGPALGRRRPPRRDQRRQRVPRPHPGHAHRHRPAGEAGAVPPAPRGVRARALRRRRRARQGARPGHGRRPCCSSRSRARAASWCRARTTSAPCGRCAPSATRCSCSTRCRPASAAPGTGSPSRPRGSSPTS